MAESRKDNERENSLSRVQPSVMDANRKNALSRVQPSVMSANRENTLSRVQPSVMGIDRENGLSRMQPSVMFVPNNNRRRSSLPANTGGVKPSVMSLVSQGHLSSVQSEALQPNISKTRRLSETPANLRRGSEAPKPSVVSFRRGSDASKPSVANVRRRSEAPEPSKTNVRRRSEAQTPAAPSTTVESVLKQIECSSNQSVDSDSSIEQSDSTEIVDFEDVEVIIPGSESAEHLLAPTPPEVASLENQMSDPSGTLSLATASSSAEVLQSLTEAVFAETLPPKSSVEPPEALTVKAPMPPPTQTPPPSAPPLEVIAEAPQPLTEMASVAAPEPLVEEASAPPLEPLVDNVSLSAPLPEATVESPDPLTEKASLPIPPTDSCDATPELLTDNSSFPTPPAGSIIEISESSHTTAHSSNNQIQQPLVENVTKGLKQQSATSQCKSDLINFVSNQTLQPKLSENVANDSAQKPDLSSGSSTTNQPTVDKVPCTSPKTSELTNGSSDKTDEPDIKSVPSCPAQDTDVSNASSVTQTPITKTSPESSNLPNGSADVTQKPDASNESGSTPEPMVEIVPSLSPKITDLSNGKSDSTQAASVEKVPITSGDDQAAESKPSNSAKEQGSASKEPTKPEKWLESKKPLPPPVSIPQDLSSLSREQMEEHISQLLAENASMRESQGAIVTEAEDKLNTLFDIGKIHEVMVGDLQYRYAVLKMKHKKEVLETEELNQELYDDQVDKHEEETKELTTRLELKTSECEDLETECEDLKTKCEDLKTEFEGLETECKDLKTECKDLKTERKSLKSQCEDLTTTTKELKDEIAYLKSRTFKKRCSSFFRRLARPFRGRSQNVSA
ncbi:serine-rich adhesin for platelets-like [Clytia hemisphaerica]|uniref:Uncharacterized protein n=1 Tax=Clytia hemisphaerica TaxID=252671 RepID=A0A7M5V9B7_9CNID